MLTSPEPKHDRRSPENPGNPEPAPASIVILVGIPAPHYAQSSPRLSRLVEQRLREALFGPLKPVECTSCESTYGHTPQRDLSSLRKPSDAQAENGTPNNQGN